MQILELLKIIAGIEAKGDIRVEFRGIQHDSRRVQPGDLFVALKGEKTNGALFIDEAAAGGAVAFACDHDPAAKAAIPFLKVPDARRFLAEAARALHGDPASHLQLAAITGTNGKTTTAHLIDAIFRHAGLTSCLAGTLGMRIGGQSFPSAHTTPEASDLAAFLHQALQAGCTHGALEVSSHALAQKRVFGTRFTVGVYSNLTPEHLDFHRDMESYYAAKRLLFLPEGGNAIRTAVINTDDDYGRRLASEVPAPVVRYGFGPDADVRVREFRTGPEQTELSFATPAGDLAVRTRLVGRPNIYNIMAAAGAALSLGIQPSAVRVGIESLRTVPGRLEPVCAGQNFSVFVDYAHTPDALEKLLETARPLAAGKVITVFGCGGDRDRRKRPVMGEIAARLSDEVIATSDNPRSEDPQQILAEIEPGLKRGRAPYRLLPDRREAIRCALAIACPGDVMVIAGKGHEDYQIIGNRIFPFDDRAVAQELIHQMLHVQGD
jgi:UDP-N-acetylmuramoyl-L-alanyl-D-glutamate--2,6-diaminopimelate ligase